MAVVVPGYNTEQKVVTVSNDDTSINTELTTQAVDNWIAVLFTVSGGNVIILFNRNVAVEEL